MFVVAFRASIQGLYVYELMRNGNLTTQQASKKKVDQSIIIIIFTMFE
jgi:hypothetical protein